MQHTPINGQYREPSEHNGAAAVSLVCAALWALSITVLYVSNLAASGPNTTGSALSQPVYFLLTCGFTMAPVVGAIAGAIGLYRAVKQPLLRKSRWWTATGLALGILWCIVAYVIIG